MDDLDIPIIQDAVCAGKTRAPMERIFLGQMSHLNIFDISLMFKVCFSAPERTI